MNTTMDNGARARMHRLLWILQIILFLVFMVSGVLKLVLPADQLGEWLTWPKEVPGYLLPLNGVAELLGALAMVLPGLTGRMPQLTSWAGYGLLVIMIMAAGFHLSHSGAIMLPANVLFGAMAGFVGWGRGSQVPLEGK